MPAQDNNMNSSSSLNIVKVSIDEMVAIMRASNTKCFIPVKIENNAAGEYKVAKIY
jgi:hypothetical protein